METIIIISIILWFLSGFYGCLTLMRCDVDINPVDLVMCVIGSCAGLPMLIIGLCHKYGRNKVIFKKFK